MTRIYVVNVVMQSISTVSAESSKLLHKALAGRLVCQHCVSSPIRRFTPPPAWIAHGILDSVVDSFFPLVEEIEEHVTAIESVVHNEDNPASTITPIPPTNAGALRILPAGETTSPANAWALPAGEKVVDEKHTFSEDVASEKTAKMQFSLPRLTCGLMLRRWRRAISRFVNFCMRNKPRSKVKPSFTRASFDLHRMARTRHLATSVARVLATKPEVVAGIRKRLLALDGPDASDDAEVAIYFGDVQGEAANIGLLQ